MARATHNIYAYRLKTQSGFIEHFDDDAEWGAGAKLLELMRSHNIEYRLLCATAWYGMSHFGRGRHDGILNAAKSVLNV